ncbi:MAG: uroporphyrinogen decarboxylase family protein [Spirochaetia bacterium]
MKKENMTPRERVRAVMKGETPDRIPMDYWATGEATAKLMKHIGVSSEDELYKKLHIDKIRNVGPDYKGPPVSKEENVFGCKFETVKYEDGTYRECVFNPLKDYQSIEEIEKNYTWPESDWWDFSRLKDKVEPLGDYPITAGGSEPFLQYCQLRGMEQAYMDMALNPEIVHYGLDKLYGLAYESTRRIFEEIPGRVDFSYVAEDMGSQTDLLFSPAQIEEFFIPWMKKMMDLIHQNGGYVFHHSDGSIRKILPRMIETGIDVLNPIQWRCKGMEREALKRDFGGQVVFHGGMDNQETLPFGTAEDVRKEVLYNLNVLGKDGGYILAPCHNIQVVSPAENLVTLYETGYQEGWS